MNERIAMVIPVHNGVEETLELLESISDSETPGLQTFVVDDGSTDHSAELIKARFPNVSILSGDGNLWWAGSTNLGIKEALRWNADYILTMNNDNLVDKGFLAPLVQTLHDFPKSIVTSKLISVSDSNYICSFGGSINWWFGEIRDRTNVRDSLDFTQLSQPEWVHASSTLYPSSIFREIGFFDNVNFPQYHGDADFSLRAAAAGYQLYVVPQSISYRRTDVSGGINMINAEGVLRNITSIRSLFYYKANYQFYAAHCSLKPFYLFLFIRYLRLVYSRFRRCIFGK